MKNRKTLLLILLVCILAIFKSTKINALNEVNVTSFSQLRDAIDNLSAGDTVIVLNSDIVSDNTTNLLTIPANCNVTITDDGSGKSLELIDCSWLVEKDAILTFKSANSANPLVINVGGQADTAVQNEFFNNKGTLSFENNKIELKQNVRSFVSNSGTLNIKETKINGGATGAALTDPNNYIDEGMFNITAGTCNVVGSTITNIIKPMNFIVSGQATLNINEDTTMQNCGTTGVKGCTEGTPILVKDSGILNIDEANFYSCAGSYTDSASSYYGGGVISLFDNAQATLTNIDASENESRWSGGFLCVFGSGVELDFSDSNLAKDKSLQNGGSLYLKNGTTTIDNVTIDGSSTENNGGGIEISDAANVEILNSTIKNCQAQDSGGGIDTSLSTGNITLKNTTISNNVVSGNDLNDVPTGGGFNSFHNTGVITIDNVVIKGNQAKLNGYGGGAYFGRGSYANEGKILVKDMTLDGNYAGSVGGGMDTANVDITIEHIIVCNNVSDTWGGGIGVHDGADNPASVKISSGEIYNNTADWLGGGIYVGKGSLFILENAAIYENTAIGTCDSYSESGWRGQGGGVWICPTGELNSYLNRGGAIFDNNAVNSGDDVGIIPSEENEYTTVASIMLGGGDYNWYQDLKGQRYSNGVLNVAQEAYYQNTKVGLQIKQTASEESKEVAQDLAKIKIYGNQATAGGGVGSNGAVVFGSQGIVGVQKVWEDDGHEDQRPASITVDLYRDDVKIESKELTAENNWHCEFRGLEYTHTVAGNPVKYVYTVSEVEVNNYESSTNITTSNEDLDVLVKITNSYIHVPQEKPKVPPTGITTDIYSLLFILGVSLSTLIGLVYLTKQQESKE